MVRQSGSARRALHFTSSSEASDMVRHAGGVMSVDSEATPSEASYRGTRAMSEASAAPTGTARQRGSSVPWRAAQR